MARPITLFKPIIKPIATLIKKCDQLIKPIITTTKQANKF